MTMRAAKNNALKAIQNTIEDNDIDNDVNVVRDTQKTVNSKPVNEFTIPFTSQNAPEGLTLDLSKQYKRKIEFCNRELMRIHNKATNKKDQDI